ncbi:ABC transporter permease [Oceanobacillus kapialis]|uniref:ABC transporter permease n=1 Tax=Oceanobacillus kapialis TaxID=481353 RepID=UPI00384F4686
MLMLLKAYIKKEAIIAKRYLANTIGGGITIFLVFLLIFYGYSGVVGFNLGDDSKESLILSFTIWILALSIYQNITDSIEEETRIGTIEQLYLSRYSFLSVITFKSFAMLLIDLIQIILLLLLMMLVTQTFLDFQNLFSILFLTIFISLNFWGLGYALAGGVLLYKKMGTYLQIFQFILLGLMFIPAEANPLFKLIPPVWGLNLLQDVMVNKSSIVAFSLSDYLYLIIPGLISLLLGVIIFKRSLSKATEKSILGFH